MRARSPSQHSRTIGLSFFGGERGTIVPTLWGAPLKRVLIIEDDRFNRRLYHDLLEAEGYEVDLAANAPEGLDRARQQRAHAQGAAGLGVHAQDRERVRVARLDEGVNVVVVQHGRSIVVASRGISVECRFRIRRQLRRMVAVDSPRLLRLVECAEQSR